MVNILAGMLAALQLICGLILPAKLPEKLHSGEWLRFHVVAQDNTAEMQRIKLCVRDAVQTCYMENNSLDRYTMLERAQYLLPLLTQAAATAALREGFCGDVSVTLGSEKFDARTLWGISVPAGDYPALMIRLGDGEGRNWWGLLDPELSLRAACVPQVTPEDGSIVWDWSIRALLSALFGWAISEGA